MKKPKQKRPNSITTCIVLTPKIKIAIEEAHAVETQINNGRAPSKSTTIRKLIVAGLQAYGIVAETTQERALRELHQEFLTKYRVIMQQNEEE